MNRRRLYPRRPAPRARARVASRVTDRSLGDRVLLDYLFELFSSSPLESFTRSDVLSVIEEVKHDTQLFPAEPPPTPRRTVPEILHT